MPDQNVYRSLSEDGRYLLLGVSIGVPPKKVEVYVQDLAAGDLPRTIVNDVEADFRAGLRGRLPLHADELEGAQLAHSARRLEESGARQLEGSGAGRARNPSRPFRSRADACSSAIWKM